MMVVGVLLIILSVALPAVQSAVQGYRLMGDARGIAAQLSLARMLAASNFTRTAVYFDTTAQTYQVEAWSKSSGILQPVSGAQPLSPGNVFGYGSVTIPAGAQTTITQTTPIYFNSRGVAVDNAGNSKGDSAIYITNNQGAYCAIAVSVAGQPSVLKLKGSAWVPF